MWLKALVAVFGWAAAVACATGPGYGYRFAFGAFGGAPGQFNGPSGVAVDPVSRDIIVADSDNHRLQRFSAGGAYLGPIGEPGLGDGQFGFSLGGAAIDAPTREVYAVDRHLARVQVFDASGAFLRKFGGFGSGSAQFARPNGIAIDPLTRDILVTDSGNHRVQVFARDGSFRASFGEFGSGDGQFMLPAGIAIDPATRDIFVADELNHRVQRFSAGGQFLGCFGEFGSGDGQFSHPAALALDAASREILVGDMFNFRVQVFGVSGEYRGQFGSHGRGEGQFADGLDLFGDGPHQNALLGIAVDPVSRSAVVSDWGNSRVQVFARPDVPQTGWWWNPAESGRGFFVEKNAAGTIFFASFLYAPGGAATWRAAVLAPEAQEFAGNLDAYQGGQTLTGDYQPASVSPGAAGPVRLEFADAVSGTLHWTGGSVPIQRFAFADNGNPPAFQPQTGWWWNPDESGRGFSIEAQGNTLFLAGYMYDEAGAPVWYLASGNLAGMSFDGNWIEFAGGQTQTGPYVAPRVVTGDAGALSLRFSSPAEARMSLPNGRIIPVRRFFF